MTVEVDRKMNCPSRDPAQTITGVAKSICRGHLKGVPPAKVRVTTSRSADATVVETKAARGCLKLSLKL